MKLNDMIERLKMQVYCIENVCNSSYDCPYKALCEEEDMRPKMVECLLMGISGIERLKADKALNKREEVNKGLIGNIGNCPMCDEVLYGGQAYCDICGQRIDWSE